MEAREGSCIQKSASRGEGLKAQMPVDMSPSRRRCMSLKGLKYSYEAKSLDYMLNA